MITAIPPNTPLRPPAAFGRQLRPSEASRYQASLRTLFPDALPDTRLIFHQPEGGLWREIIDALRDEQSAGPVIIGRRKHGTRSDEFIYHTNITAPWAIRAEVAMDNASGNRQSQVRFLTPQVAVVRRHYPLS